MTRSTLAFGSLSRRQADPEDLATGPSNNGLQRTGCTAAEPERAMGIHKDRRMALAGSQELLALGMKWMVLLLLTITPLALVAAQEATTCSEAGSQLQLNACGADDFARADKEMDDIYAALIQKDDKDRTFVEKLRAAQRAWLAFREAGTPSNVRMRGL